MSHVVKLSHGYQARIVTQPFLLLSRRGDVKKNLFRYFATLKLSMENFCLESPIPTVTIDGHLT